MNRTARTAQVLVIEDDRDLRYLMGMILRKKGMPCTLSGSVDDGLKHLRGTEFDAILLDLALPGVSGFDFIETLRKENPAILSRVVVVTGLAPSQCGSLDLKELGGMVRKPFSVEDLVDRVRSCVTDRETSTGH